MVVSLLVGTSGIRFISAANTALPEESSSSIDTRDDVVGAEEEDEHENSLIVVVCKLTILLVERYFDGFVSLFLTLLHAQEACRLARHR